MKLGARFKKKQPAPVAERSPTRDAYGFVVRAPCLPTRGAQISALRMDEGRQLYKYRASVASRRVNVFFVLFSPAPFAATERALTEELPINAFVRWDARRSSRSWWASTR